MFEDSAMDKKPSVRSGQGPSKGNSSEAKKNQDATNGKQFPRGARKREPPNSNGFKTEQSRKPLPQKSKALDKRPKPRGFYYGSGKEGVQVTDQEFDAEFGPLLETGSKRQSLNHLLNFHYEPRGENLHKRAPQHGASTKSLMATHAHKYNKEQFLQANCQFVVREGGDYSFNLGDPDLLVDWAHVELIITSSCEKVVCPICLYPPVAGKITRCGHIYCWSCILHYLALSDKTWRKCPICYEAIHKKDLRSVECVEKVPYSIGQKITMRLMKREKGTLIATPVSQYASRTKKPILGYGEKELDIIYSKLLTASKQNVSEIIAREYAELQMQVNEFKGCPELCFVEQALELLTERKSTLESPGYNINAAVSIPNNTPDVQSPVELTSNISSSPEEKETPIELINGLEKQRSESESAGSEGDEANITAEDLEIKSSNDTQRHYYFYQAADGQHIYLHSINARMLEMSYGSLEKCPLEITGKIVEKEAGSMTPQLRKRLRYLQHVPITCQFEVVEIEMHPPTITDETFAHFQDQVEERRKRRLRHAQAEKRREKKIEEAERRQFLRMPAPNLRIESLHDFPECGIDESPRSFGDFLPSLQSGHSSRSESPVNDHRSKSPFSSAVAALSIDQDDSGPSFAQMLREGKTMTTGEAWPSIGSEKPAVKSAAGSCWGRRQRQVSITHESADSDNDALFSPPAKPTFNIAEAIQLAATREKEENVGGGRKKKKKHQKILFSTGIPKGN